MDSSDYADFDVDRSISQAWTEFEARLSEVISLVDDSADLTIGTEAAEASPAGRPGGPFVTFSAPAPGVVRCEAASNAQLVESYQLGTDQLVLMEQIGWQPPISERDAAEHQPTPNFWAEDTQEHSDRLAGMTVAALRDAYGIQHPVFLAPDQLAEVLTPKVEPAPRLDPGLDDDDVIATLATTRDHLDAMVESELTDLFGHPPIRDAEGDIAIRIGSTMLFLRTSSDGREIVIFSALVHDVSGRSRAMEVLNDLNCDARWVKFQLIRDRVFVTLSVPAYPFVPAHLRQGVQILSEVADGIDEELAVKLDGRTTFEEHG